MRKSEHHLQQLISYIYCFGPNRIRWRIFGLTRAVSRPNTSCLPICCNISTSMATNYCGKSSANMTTCLLQGQNVQQHVRLQYNYSAFTISHWNIFLYSISAQFPSSAPFSHFVRGKNKQGYKFGLVNGLEIQRPRRKISLVVNACTRPLIPYIHSESY